MTNTTCFTCSNLMGCSLLADKKGVFNDKIVKAGDTCNNWSPINQSQKDVRDVLYGIQGEGCLRVLHQVPSMIMEQLIKEEGVNEMDLGEMPDLAGMLREGMTTTEREEQLRYETNEQGEVLYDEPGSDNLDEPIKRSRPSYQLRKFACDTEGHIQLDHSVGIYWTNERVIKHILAVEVEQGLIEKPKKGKSKNKPAAQAATTETNMAKEGRRVLVNRGGKGAAPAKAPGPKPASAGPKPAGTKVGTPPARRGAKPAQAAAPAPEPDVDEGGNGPTASEGPAFDIQAFLEDIQVAVGETVTRAVEEAKNEILGAITGTHSENIDATTLLQDRLALTAGSMQWVAEDEETYQVPPLFGTERGVLEHVEGLDPEPPK